MVFPVTRRKAGDVFNSTTYLYSSTYSVMVGKNFADGYIGCENPENMQQISTAYFYKEGKLFEKISILSHK